MADRSDADICVLLPTLDEAATIVDVVEGFVREGFDNVLVIDGGSTDGTRELAREAGARVVVQSGSGKGQAVREGVRNANADVVLMADADATYDPGQADRLLHPILEGTADHVIGNRFADMKPGAMTRLNRFGNRIINTAFRLIHGENYRDILSGYRAFTTDSFQQLTLTADGFGIETEMSVECAKRDMPTAVVPITYAPRPSGSTTNLHPLRDGGIIFMELYRKAKTSNPLFYFGSVGAVSTSIGLVLGLFVIYRWLVAGVGHEIVAIGAVAGVLFGVQLLMFGVLSDMMLSLHREQLSRIDQLETEDGAGTPEADAERTPGDNAEMTSEEAAEKTSEISKDARSDGGRSDGQ